MVKPYCLRLVFVVLLVLNGTFCPLQAYTLPAYPGSSPSPFQAYGLLKPPPRAPAVDPLLQLWLLSAENAEDQGETIAVVQYQADDRVIFDAKQKTLALYGKSVLNYDNVKLEAHTITLDLNSHMVIAHGIEDQHNKLVEHPILTYQDVTKDRYGKKGDVKSRTFFMEKLRYNIHTKRLVVDGLLAKQEDSIVKSVQTKREDEQTFYAQDTIYTTCGLEEPHFYIRAKRAKFIQDEQITSGPFRFYFTGVPTPLGCTFGTLFLPGKRKHGVIPGNLLVEEKHHGFGLEEVGYYCNIKDYVTCKVVGSVYADGFTHISPEIAFQKRYFFRGSISYNLQIKPSKGFEQRGEVHWTQNCSNIPSSALWYITALNAKIRLATDQYETREKDDKKIATSGKGKTDSSLSILYTQKIGPFSLTVSPKGNRKQEMRTDASDSNANNASVWQWHLDLPISLGASWYPFRRVKTMPAWLNQLVLKEKHDFKWTIRNHKDIKKLADDDRRSIDRSGRRYNDGGLLHELELKTDCKLFEYFTFTPNVTGKMAHYGKKDFYAPNASYPIEQRGFYTVYGLDLSGTLVTHLYCHHAFANREQLLQAFRIHSQPSLCFTYTPSFSERLKCHQVIKKKPQYLFEGRIPPLSIKDKDAAVIKFTLANDLKLKIKKSEDPNGDKKNAEKDHSDIELLKLTLTTAYDFIARPTERFKPIELDTKSTIPFSRLGSVGLSAQWEYNPYICKYEKNLDGTKMEEVATPLLVWEKGFNLGSGSMKKIEFGLMLNLQGKDGHADEQKKEKQPSWDSAIGNYDADEDKKINFDIPWECSCEFHWRRTKKGTYSVGNSCYDYTKYINLRGAVTLFKKWKIELKTAYDLHRQRWKISEVDTELSISRDLHCMEFKYTLYPFLEGTVIHCGYSFKLSFKASALKALKWPRERKFATLSRYKERENAKEIDSLD